MWLCKKILCIYEWVVVSKNIVIFKCVGGVKKTILFSNVWYGVKYNLFSNSLLVSKKINFRLRGWCPIFLIFEYVVGLKKILLFTNEWLCPKNMLFSNVWLVSKNLVIIDVWLVSTDIFIFECVFGVQISFFRKCVVG